jgi:protein-S-isoprenylcysteine O-methyltransferase Ste14
LSFLIIFANMAVLWASWFSMCSIDIYKIDIPSVIRYSGLALSAAGVVMFLVSLLTIRTLETYEGDLITRGIYSRVRHPMYLSFIFWLIGFPVFMGSVNSFLLSILFISNVLFWRHLEELELETRFPKYKEYKQGTFF